MKSKPSYKERISLALRWRPVKVEQQVHRHDTNQFGMVASYNLPVVGFSAMSMLIVMYYMKFATDVLLIAPGVIGTIFGLARLWDAFTDPLVGYLSDRTNHKMGRRRPWLLYSAVPIGVTYILAFAPPEGFTGLYLTIWVTVTIFVFYTATTAFVIPHMSWGAELSIDGKSRNRLFGYRYAASILGFTIGLAGVAMMLYAEESGPQAARLMALRLSVFAAIAMALSLIYTSFSLKEREDFQGRCGKNPFHSYRDVLRNEHARRILFATFVEHSGMAVTSVMSLYVTEYVIKVKAYGPVFLLVWLVFAFMVTPIWIRLARLYGKKQVWIFSLIVSALFYGSLIFLGEGDVWHLMIVCVVTGAAAGCGGTIGPSTQSDIIDYDELKTGERKEGAYFACWNFVVKAAYGITIMFAGAALQWSGFIPQAEQTDLVKMTMVGYFAIFPFFTYLVGAVVLSGFKFDETAHAEVRAIIAARAAKVTTPFFSAETETKKVGNPASAVGDERQDRESK